MLVILNEYVDNTELRKRFHVWEIGPDIFFDEISRPAQENK